MPPKTRSGKKSRPSEEETEEQEKQLQTQLETIEDLDEEEEEEQLTSAVADAFAAAQRPPTDAAAAIAAPTPAAAAAADKKPRRQLEEYNTDDDSEEEDVKRPAREYLQSRPAPRYAEDEEEDDDDDDDDDERAPTALEISKLAKTHRDRFYHDILDYEQELVLTDRASRQTHWKVLEHFTKIYPYKERFYGRVYVRTKLCSLLFDACAEPGYSDTSLVAWSADEWNDMVEDLEVAKAACLRADCRSRMPSACDAEKDEERSHLPCFNSRFEVMIKACHLNGRLAPIRRKLEKQIADGLTGSPVLSATKVETMYNGALDSDSDMVKRYIYSFFEPDEDGRADEAKDEFVQPKSVLKNLEDLKEILSVKPFDLKWIQHRMESLVLAWNEACFGSAKPTLLSLGYNRHNKAKQQQRCFMSPNRLSRQTTPRSRLDKRRLKELDSRLKRKRDALRENHGEDPLEASRELAEQATGILRATHKKEPVKTQRAGRAKKEDDDDEDEEEVERASSVRKGSRALYEEKKTKSTLAFDDTSDDGDDDDDEDFSPARARLSKVAERRKSTGSAKRASIGIYQGPPPDEGVFDEIGNVVRRHPWTDEEMNALASGLEKFGVGKWVQIKNEYGHILRNRNSVQVKDKYRNMKRSGELPDKFL